MYDNFIETDDENIIASVKFLVRFYANKDKLRLLSALLRWKNKAKKVKLNVFDKLFLESEKKANKKLVSEEMKELKELEECTFQPNINKYK